MPFIYKTVNLITGKIYIGQTRTDNDSYLGSGIWICNAIKKYGKENFCRELIEICDVEYLNEREQYWISFYNSSNPDIGYNLTSGGRQSTKFSKISRQKLSDSKKGKRIVYKHSEETKQKMSESKKGKKVPAIAKSKLGKTHSDETKQKMSESHKSLTPEQKEKLRLSRLGKTHSEETKQRMSESHKGRVAWNKGCKTGTGKK